MANAMVFVDPGKGFVVKGIRELRLRDTGGRRVISRHSFEHAEVSNREFTLTMKGITLKFSIIKTSRCIKLKNPAVFQGKEEATSLFDMHWPK